MIGVEVVSEEEEVEIVEEVALEVDHQEEDLEVIEEDEMILLLN